MVGLLLVAQLSLRGRGHVDRPTVLVMTVAAILGMPLGLLVLTQVEERVLTLLIAAAVITFAVLLWRAPAAGHRGTDAVAGFAAGILSTSTGTSGPPIVIALSTKDMQPTVFRATISAIFLVQGSAALVAFALGGQVTMDALAVALPVSGSGAGIDRRRTRLPAPGRVDVPHGRPRPAVRLRPGGAARRGVVVNGT